MSIRTDIVDATDFTKIDDHKDAVAFALRAFVQMVAAHMGDGTYVHPDYQNAARELIDSGIVHDGAVH